MFIGSNFPNGIYGNFGGMDNFGVGSMTGGSGSVSGSGSALDQLDPNGGLTPSDVIDSMSDGSAAPGLDLSSLLGGAPLGVRQDLLQAADGYGALDPSGQAMVQQTTANMVSPGLGDAIPMVADFIAFITMMMESFVKKKDQQIAQEAQQMQQSSSSSTSGSTSDSTSGSTSSNAGSSSSASGSSATDSGSSAAGSVGSASGTPGSSGPGSSDSNIQQIQFKSDVQERDDLIQTVEAVSNMIYQVLQGIIQSMGH
jgi:hypothetical protein